ncbi:unnamed protein product [Cyprideis torosa]|uniref:Membrane-bound transcription factor site-1 protease n=1 Tax=Cyprideis torosa TaxID=163714 RepID=A0A7R8W1F6_9CRUS|nr:unnamed protein product [Cyprideis torosa]CAG0880863.1 unnamed protein product [Cyprideis torosa]
MSVLRSRVSAVIFPPPLLCIALIFVSSYFTAISSSSPDKMCPSSPGVISSLVSPNEEQDEGGSYVEFTTSIVPDHYLIHFQSYHLKGDREKIIVSSLMDSPTNASHMENLQGWHLIPRNNPSYDLPSDFEIIDFHGLNNERLKKRAVELLRRNPAVKAVTPERSVTRHIHSFAAELSNETPPQHAAAGAPPPPQKAAGSTRSRHTGSRRLMKSVAHQVTSVLGAKQLWDLGITGAGVKVAVFDTGLARNHPHFKRVKERTNWTDEKTLDDLLGHGTFVAGVITSSGEKCPGLAPDAELYIFRVFTDKQVSYTSWFLDAFNYAIVKKVHVLNLSIGGPDFMDQPFVDKVWELTANGITMISAIGNDGPLYGTHNNPADQLDVIGVGGINFEDDIAKFSSRGMTTWELPSGYGRVKPDIVTYGSYVRGSSNVEGCRSLSGTSVASPVVAGAVALLASGVLHRGNVINPASIKQTLMSTATRLPLANMFEQGSGKLDLHRAYHALLAYEPQASLSPSYLDLTECPYFWPYCTQGVYHGSLPVLVNVTILNGMGVSGRIVGEPIWHPYMSQGGSYLELSFKYSKLLWPWSGYLAIAIQVSEEGKEWEGIAQGHVTVVIESPAPVGTTEENSKPRISNLTLPIRVKVIPTPPKHKRILWDQFHNLRYPPGYFPRDALSVTNDPLDWNGDHPHTNFKGMYTALRNAGYYLEVLGQPFTCLESPHKSYGSLLIVDPEEEFFSEEIFFLQSEVKKGLSLIIFADWYNSTVMKKIQFRDDSTRGMWIPVTGGCNVPALNDLLSPWGISLGDTVLEGPFTIGHNAMHFVSGVEIMNFPRKKAATLLSATLKDQGLSILEKKSLEVSDAVILGLLNGEHENGNIAVYGDSNCLDDAHMEKPDCYWLLEALLEWVATNKVPAVFTQESTRLATPRGSASLLQSSPSRMDGSELWKFSKVLENIPGSTVHQPIPECIKWDVFDPQPLNRTAPTDLYKPPLKIMDGVPSLIPPSRAQGIRRLQVQPVPPLVLTEPASDTNGNGWKRTQQRPFSYGLLFSYLLMVCALIILCSQFYCRFAHRRRLCRLGRICNALHNTIRNV